MSSQKHSGSGDNIGRDKITKIRLRINPKFAFLLILALLISGVLALKYINDNKPKIHELTITGFGINENKELSTLDDVRVKWTYSGQNEEIKIKLTQLESGKETGFFKGMLYDNQLFIPQKEIAELYKDASLHKNFSVRITAQLRDRNFQFGPFGIMTGLNVLYYYNEENDALEIYTQTMNTGLLRHSAELRAVCYAKDTLDIQSLIISLANGKAKVKFPNNFNPDLSTLRIIYFGSYPEKLVRYNNLNEQ